MVEIAVTEAARSSPKPVRLAAIGALGRVGNATCLSPLLDIALESDADLVKAAKEALKQIGAG
jgi:HEAT repeat protein